MELDNPTPVVRERRRGGKRQQPVADCTDDDSARQPIDCLEVYEHIRDITDPEHPYSLEQLDVVHEDRVQVDDGRGRVRVQFTPTVEHCSMATLIGLCIRVRLLRTLPPRFKVEVLLTPGSHASEGAVNKQLNDKERVAAALENPPLLAMVERCLAAADDGGGA